MILLPIANIFIVYCLLYNTGKRSVTDGSHAIIYTITLNVLLMYGMTEVLSLFNAVNFYAISVVWGICTLFSLCILVKKRVSICECISFSFVKDGFYKSIIFWCIVLICGVVFILSICIVPYNWDSMTYHIPRIMHWIQNGSVAHYACHDISQISDPPLAEFVNMHVYLLSGKSDKLLNLLQTFSYYLIIYFVYKISRRIGVSRRGGLFAALLYATIPTVFGEALMTQVDLFASVWFVSFVYLTIDFIEEKQLIFDGKNFVRILIMGAVAGISYLSKPHVCIGMLIFALWIIIRCIQRKDKLKEIFLFSGTAVGSALLIAIPEMVRNFITFGSFAAKESSTGFLMSNFSPTYILLNCMLHIGSNMNNTFVDISSFIKKVIGKTSLILTGDSHLPSELSMWRNINPDNYDVDMAINSVVTYLFVFALLLFIIICISNIRKKERLVINQQYIVISFTAIIMFMVMVNWYRYVNRYLVGYYAVIIPAVVLVFELAARNKPRFYEAFISIGMFTTLMVLIPMLDYHFVKAFEPTSRFEKYFSVRGLLYEPYEELLGDLKENGYTQLGFICGVDSYEYPLWYGLKEQINEFRHFDVDNETKKYSEESFVPECVIVVDREMPEEIECKNIRYIRKKIYYDDEATPVICYYVIEKEM